MLMGRGGATMKMLQTETGCKFTFKGRGSNKNGEDEDPDSPLYVVVRGETESNVRMGVEHVEKIFFNEEYRNALRESQGIKVRKSVQENFAAMNGRPGTKNVVYYIPSDKVGLVIGKGGTMIVQIQRLSGCNLQVERETDEGDPNRRKLHLNGTEAQLIDARRNIQDVISGYRPEQPGEVTEYEMVPQHMIGRVIGKGGETIRRLEKDHGCMVKVLPAEELRPGETLDPEVIREVLLRGYPATVTSAKYEVQQLTDFTGAHLKINPEASEQIVGSSTTTSGATVHITTKASQPAKSYKLIRIPENWCQDYWRTMVRRYVK
eukprot:UN24888